MRKIAQEMWFVEAETSLRRWNDPGFLSPSVDQIDRQFKQVIRAAHPLLTTILRATEEVPYRAKVFAQRIKKELELDADHLDRFLDKKSLWSAEDFKKFEESITTSAKEIQHLYVDLIPYMVGARLPYEQEVRLLSALGPMGDLQIPGTEETPLLTEDAEFTEVEGSVRVESKGFSGVAYKDFIKVLQRLGWYRDRHGKHEVWRHNQIRWNIPVPTGSQNLSENVLRNHLQRMGISKEDLEYMLNKRLQKADPQRMEYILKNAPAKAAEAKLHGVSQ